MRLFKRGKHNEVDTSEMEAYLREVFQPAAPRPEFVRKLRQQLVRELAPTQEQTRNEKRRVALVVGASLIGGVLALLMGVRTILTLAAALGLLLELNKETQVHKVLPHRQIE